MRARIVQWLAVFALWLAGCSSQPSEYSSNEFRSLVSGSVAPEADAWLAGDVTFRNLSNVTTYYFGVDSSPPERAVIRFSPVAIQNEIAGEFVGATLRLKVNFASGFGAGQTVRLHRLIQPWEENAVTFNCAVDANTANATQDCSGPTQWDLTPGGDNPWIEDIATTTITDSSTVLEFDVTAEVAALLAGTIDHHGWAIVLDDSAPGYGQIQLRESPNPPELEIEYETDPPATTTDWTPPEPEEVAPDPDLTVIEGMAEGVAFLYEGEDPVQIDVDEEAIEPARVGVIRGVVEARSGIPLGDVEVRIADHPEYGMTKTRPDGAFDIAANGGGPLVLEFSREGLFEANRRVDVQWNEFVDVGTVVMIGPDPNVTTIEFVDPIEAAISTASIDGRGVRRNVVLFREDTIATMYVPGESPEVLPSIDVRATEYTVGESGPEAMPGPLPRSTGYTYAVDFSVDEAEAAGATKVTFDPPAISYVDNFLNAQVGQIVPAGAWDDEKKTWVPSADGLIIKIVGEDSGLALITLDNDNTPESELELEGVGIDESEREALYEIYGDDNVELWRVETPHFSAWDFNWGVQPPEDAESCTGCGVDPPLERMSTQCGSIIECEGQVLGESVPVAGTGLTLNWRSSRVRGGPSYRMKVKLSDDTWNDDPPVSVSKMRTYAEVAGRRLEWSADPDDWLTHEFVWDGKDIYGRQVQGARPMEVCVAYDYPMAYTLITTGGGGGGGGGSWSGSKFGYKGNGFVIGVNQTSQTTSLTRCFGRVPIGTGGDSNAISTPNRLLIGGLDAARASDALGGWTLSNHHTFSKEASTVYYGDGSKRDVGGAIPMIETYMGNGTTSGPYTGADRLAVQVGSAAISAIASAPDGDLYVGYTNRVVKVERDDNIVYAVAGNGTAGHSGDGGAATSALIKTPAALDVGPDGSLYILDASNYVIRRVRPDGVIERVAGVDGPGNYSNDFDSVFAEDDLTALNRPLGGLSGYNDLAVGPEGDIYYFASAGGQDTLRHILPNGQVRHFAGYPRANNWAGMFPGGSSYYGHSPIWFPISDSGSKSLFADADGGVWVGQSSMVRFADVAESVSPNTDINSGAGPLGVTPGGHVIWFSSNFPYENQVVTLFDGVITPLAGGGTFETANNIPALNAKFLNNIVDLVVGPDGAIYIAYNRFVRRIYLDGPGSLFGEEDVEIPSADGSEIHVFDDDGRHLTTRDAVTGVTLWNFGYDEDGRLTSMTDRNGRNTTIQRDSFGVAQSITSPDEIVTALEVVDDKLESVTDEVGSTWEFGYDAESGLLETMTDPREYLHEYTYDGSGRLILDEDAGNGSKTLTRTEYDLGFEVEVETALGQVSGYRVDPGISSRLKRVRTRPDGTQTETESFRDGRTVTTHADGTVVTTWTDPDPRFGMLAPITSRTSVAYPVGGLTGNVYHQRFESGDDWVEQISRFHSFEDPLEYRYDTITREGTITSPEGRVTTFELDAVGRLLEYTAPGAATVYYEYDLQGRLIEVEQGSGGDLRKTTFAYDGSSGFLETLTAFLGVDYGMTYDAIGRILSVVLPDLESVGLEWDEEGRLVELTVPTDLVSPEPHAMSYDPVGMMTVYNPPDATNGPDPDETMYSYDDDHRPTQVTLPNAATINVSYDPTTHRVGKVTTSEGAVLLPTYDSAGRISNLKGPYWVGDPAVANVELIYGYNGPLVTSEEWVGDTAGTVSRVFNSRGLVTNQQINGSMAASYSYDEDNLMLSAGSVTLSRSATTGQIESVTLSNISQSLSYDAFGAVDGSTYAHTTGPTNLYEYSLERDQFGQIIQETKIVDGGTPEVWTYEYDERGRLERVEVDSVLFEEYTYDPNGNRLSLTTSGGTTYATYDEQDRIIDYGDWEYTHGANGEIVSKTDGVDVWEYEYDALGYLILVTLPDTTEIRYEYDGRGRPVARYVDDVYEKGWLWGNQLEPVAEVDDQADVVVRYVYGSRAHVPDYIVKGGVTYRIVTDYRGSVLRVVNASTGYVEQDIKYGPWGAVLSNTAPGFQVFGFAGGLWDADTGLVLFGVRWYDAELGRWTMKDPVRFAGTQSNFYQYVHADPLSYVDLSGAIPMDGWPHEFQPDFRGAWERLFIGVRDHNTEAYYEARGYSNVTVRVGGWLDWIGNLPWVDDWSEGAYVRGDTVRFGSNCDPKGDVRESYPSHDLVTRRDHELGHVIDFRRHGALAFIRGSFDRMRNGEHSWFEHRATRYGREIWGN